MSENCREHVFIGLLPFVGPPLALILFTREWARNQPWTNFPNLNVVLVALVILSAWVLLSVWVGIDPNRPPTPFYILETIHGISAIYIGYVGLALIVLIIDEVIRFFSWIMQRR